MRKIDYETTSLYLAISFPTCYHNYYYKFKMLGYNKRSGLILVPGAMLCKLILAICDMISNVMYIMLGSTGVV